MSPLNKPKLLSDENVPIKVIDFLAREGFDIKQVPLGSTDKKISKLAKSESRIIITFDKHFINRNLFPPKEYSGIIFLNIHPPIIETVINSLMNLFKNIPKFDGKLLILSHFGFRVKE